uniref:ATP synthase complex subunit 8 n=1 Tax=Chirocentrus dorab TaxID=221863 RepID=Q5GMF3_9TELE|nr:ATPase subunits 8 [Chirocentrus dorab]BBF17081.1 ATPase subunit 8 [Chirocentrus dorab]BBU25492.1 ATPase subunit 8 [Chirocentrus dorab]
MPQLDPSPWFAILVFSWAIFLMILPPKVLAHQFNNEPTLKSTEAAKPEPWMWSWH